MPIALYVTVDGLFSEDDITESGDMYNTGISGLRSIVYESGSINLHQDELHLDFPSGVYITGSGLSVENDITVSGDIYTTGISGLHSIVYESGGINLHQDKLHLDLPSGVYVT